jgi:hypothetical protein
MRPGIGDPTFKDWFMVLAYALAAALCWRAAVRYPGLPSSGGQMLQLLKPGALTSTSGGLWIGLTGLFILLAVSRQLDLHTWLIAVGRELARSEGWYEHRRVVQAIFVIAAATGGSIVFLKLAWLTRRDWRTTGLAVAGATFIITLIVIRAASFHHVDILLGWTVLGVRLNWALELCGIACVAIAALHAQPTGSARETAGSGMRSPGEG